MAYPNDIDSFPEYEDRDIAHGIEGTLVVNAMFQIIYDAVVAVETVLGTLPQGAQATVRQRLENIEAIKLNLAGGTLTGMVNFVDDTWLYFDTAQSRGIKFAAGGNALQFSAGTFLNMNGGEIESVERIETNLVTTPSVEMGSFIIQWDSGNAELNIESDNTPGSGQSFRLKDNAPENAVEILTDRVKIGIFLEGTSYIKTGNRGSLPTPIASDRGKMIRVEGGAGVADVLYINMKSAGDTYSWVVIATG